MVVLISETVHGIQEAVGERERLQKRVEKLEELINGEKES